MKTIKEKVVHTIDLKKSKFITYLFPLDQKEEIELFLRQVVVEHKDASHHCYAYLFDQLCRSSDDGEPSGTAGNAMLEILKSMDCNRILVVTVRYFGGIKLGASGLSRAYRSSVREAISASELLTLIDGLFIEITASYEESERLKFLFSPFSIISETYLDTITYQVLIPEEALSLFSFYHPKILAHQKVIKKEFF